MSLLKLEKVSKSYRTRAVEFKALKEISLSVAEGEFLSIAGPSGSGKTTLLNIIGCLDRPSSGTVFLLGSSIGLKRNVELAEIRRHKIGFIFQTFNLIPILTAFENVELPLTLKGNMSKGERRAQVEEILADVGLIDFMNRKPLELSGGQQQRVAIARALIKKPQMVLADEPTANLDSRIGAGILELMLRLNRKTACTFIFSTHDQMVINFGRRVIRLKDGEVEADEKRG